MLEHDTSSRIRVLVVDDFADGRDLLQEYLALRGFAVHVACGGAEAIEITRRVRPAIVLMDLGMPGIDGWEAARRITNDPELRGIVVIGVTAHAFASDTDAAIKAGCEAVICKPFDITALADALPGFLNAAAPTPDFPGFRSDNTAGPVFPETV